MVSMFLTSGEADGRSSPLPCEDGAPRPCRASSPQPGSPLSGPVALCPRVVRSFRAVSPAPVQPGSPKGSVRSFSTCPGVRSFSPGPGVRSFSPGPGVRSFSLGPGVRSFSPRPGVRSLSLVSPRKFRPISPRPVPPVSPKASSVRGTSLPGPPPPTHVVHRVCTCSCPTTPWQASSARMHLAAGPPAGLPWVLVLLWVAGS